jgi:hypothetical protein
MTWVTAPCDSSHAALRPLQIALEIGYPKRADIEAIRIVLDAESKRFRRNSNRIALAISQAINFQLILALPDRLFLPIFLLPRAIPGSPGSPWVPLSS